MPAVACASTGNTAASLAAYAARAGVVGRVYLPAGQVSLNKLAQGIADNLALSLTAEAIGRGTPVVVALSVNPPLFRHPRTAQSIAELRRWGVSVVEPQDAGQGLRLAPVDSILEEVDRRRI